MNDLRSAWQKAAVGYTTGLVAGGVAGIFPQSAFWNLLSFFGLVYFLYGLWQVARASGRREVFALNLWATLIQFASLFLFGLALAPTGLATGDLAHFKPSAGAVVMALLAYVGFVYGAYLEMRGLSALAGVGGVPLVARGGRIAFVGALLVPVLVGLLVMLVGYLMVAVGLWQGPRLKADA